MRKSSSKSPILKTDELRLPKLTNFLGSVIRSIKRKIIKIKLLKNKIYPNINNLSL
jgi:hypothetical protein